MNKQKAKEYTVEVGDMIQIYCNGCQTEYQVIHEPVYTDQNLRKQFGGKAKPAIFCPFCGTEDQPDLEVRG